MWEIDKGAGLQKLHLRAERGSDWRVRAEGEKPRPATDPDVIIKVVKHISL